MHIEAQGNTKTSNNNNHNNTTATTITTRSCNNENNLKIVGSSNRFPRVSFLPASVSG